MPKAIADRFLQWQRFRIKVLLGSAAQRKGHSPRIPTAPQSEGRIFFRSAWQALKRRRTNMDVPISIGVLLAFGMSDLFQQPVTEKDFPPRQSISHRALTNADQNFEYVLLEFITH